MIMDKKGRLMVKAVFTVISLVWLLATGASAAPMLHSQWGELLARHVKDGVVDYQGFKDDEAELDEYLGLLARTEPGELDDGDRLAYYINGYNSYTVKLILNNFKDGTPPQSIRRIGGLFSNPWKISFAVLGGRTLSLDNIEHDIIRVEFDEPRIHFAVNCASKSCPVLISEPYRGEDLDQQLEESTRRFLENPEHNYLEGDTLYVSSIFKWYKEDFDDDPVSFFLAHTTGSLKQALLEKGGAIRVKYVDYDWSLNGSSD
jgi:hypothetical protein